MQEGRMADRVEDLAEIECQTTRIGYWTASQWPIVVELWERRWWILLGGMHIDHRN